jgi:hypothetical protein
MKVIIPIYHIYFSLQLNVNLKTKDTTSPGQSAKLYYMCDHVSFPIVNFTFHISNTPE